MGIKPPMPPPDSDGDNQSCVTVVLSWILPVSIGVFATLFIITLAVSAFYFGRTVADRPPSTDADDEQRSATPDQPSPRRSSISEEGPSVTAPATGRSPPNFTVAEVIERVEPSVVQLNVFSSDGGSVGSGFVCDKSGTIVTNSHVVAGATGIRITFSDGSTTRALGWLVIAPERDLAAIRVDWDEDRLYPLPLSDSVPRKGEAVVAIGSPRGLSLSASEGIVGAIRTPTELVGLGKTLDCELIQTTAPISPGNSGGPLVNLKGELIGVNTLRTAAWFAENINFAVSVTNVRDVLLAARSSRLRPFSAAASVAGSAIEPTSSEPVVPKEPDIEFVEATPKQTVALTQSLKRVRLGVFLNGSPPSVIHSSDDAIREKLIQQLAVVLKEHGVEIDDSDEPSAGLMAVLTFADGKATTTVDLGVVERRSDRVQISRVFSHSNSSQLEPGPHASLYVRQRKAKENLNELIEGCGHALTFHLNHFGSTSNSGPRADVPDREDPEVSAKRMLLLAKPLLQANPTRAKERLESIAQRYPETDAGREARYLLTEKSLFPHEE